MLQLKRHTHMNIKKHNKKFLNFYCSHHQTLFINTVLNINKLINLSKLILKIKSVRAKSVKNTMNIINNIVDIFALLKWNTETEHSKEEYCT